MSEIGDSPSHKVPLDSSDAAYLGKCFHSPRAKNTPSWSNRKLDEESEDCPVLAITKAIKNEECYSEPSETDKCHICNVNVPRTCHQKHNASDQHKNMKRIYENVLDSVTKHISINKIPDGQDFGDDVYYCKTCSKIIKLENRQKHETSDYHSRSQNDLNIINDFYKLLKERKSYDDRKENEVVSSKVNETRLSVGNEARVSEVNGVTLSEVNDARLSEVDDVRLSEGNEASMSEENDARLSEANETRLCEDNEASVSEVNDARLSEVNETRLSEGNEASVSEENDARLSERCEARLSEVIDARLSEANETRLYEDNEASVSEVNDARLSEVNDGRLSEKNDARLSEGCEARLSEVNDARLSEGCEARLSEVNDARLNEANETSLCEGNEASVSEVNDARLSEVNDARLREENDASLSEGCEARLSEVNDARLSEANETSLCEGNEASVSEVNDARLSEANETRLCEDNEASVSEVNDAGLSEANEKRLSEGNEASVSEVNDARLREGSEARLSEVNDARLSEVNDARLIEANDARLSEGNDTSVSEVNDARLHEGCEARPSEVNDAKLSEANETSLSEGNEASVSEVNDARLSEVNDARLSEMNDPKLSELNETRLSEGYEARLSEVTDAKLSELNETISSELNETRFGEENEELFSELNEGVFIDLNEAGPTGLNHLVTERLEENNDDINIDLNEAGPSGLNHLGTERLEVNNDDIKIDLNEAGPSGLNHLVTERLEENNDDIKIYLNEAGPSRLNHLVTERLEEINDDIKIDLNEAGPSGLNHLVTERLEENNDDLKIDLNEAGPSGLNHLVTERFEENNNDINDKIIDASISSLDSDDDTLDQDEIPMPQTEENIIETKTQTPKEEKKPLNEQEQYSFEEYVKDMINKYDLKVKLPVIEGDFIWMVAPSGAVVKISRYDFHSYRGLMNNVYCQLCSKWLTLNTRNHDTTEKHVRKVFRPINDQFTRWLDKRSNHCVLCNDVVVKGSESHTINHPYIPEKILCKDCNTYIDCVKFIDHVDSDSHLNVVMSHNSIKDMVSNYAYCKICQQTMPRSVVKYHVNSKVHIRKTAKELAVLSDETNSNKNNDSNSVQSNLDRALNSEYCDICNVNVPLGGMQVHTNGKNHKKIVNQNKNDVRTEENSVSNGSIDGSVTNNDDLASTNLDSINVASTDLASTDLDSISTTNDDLTSATCFSPNASTSSLKDDVDNKMEVYSSLTEYANREKTVVRCKICSVNIIFKEKNIVEHMEGKNHKANANKPKMLGYNKLMFTVDNNKTELKCRVCGVNIPYVGNNISEHIRGKNHEDAEIDLIKFHLIIKERSNYFCECCEVQTTDYLEHINSRTHTLQLLQKYKIDNAEMRKYVYDENLNDPVSHRHKELYNNLLKFNGIYKLEYETCFYCNTCKIKLGRKSEIDHVLGEKHGSRIEKMNKLSALLEQLDMTDVITR